MNQTFYLIAIFCFWLTSAKLLDESIKEHNFELDDDEIEDYAQIFKQSENAEAFIKSQLPKLSSKNKRFLGSILDIFRSKNKTHTTSSSYVFDSNTNDHFRPTTYKPAINYQSSSAMLHSSISDDPFYKLKQYCIKTYDSFCISKKHEINSLVQKCGTFEKNVKPESCKEVLSIYCYVFSSHDIFTCYRNDYDIYIPGVKKFTSATQHHTTHSTSRIYIPVVHVTTSSYRPYSFSSSYRAPSTYSTTFRTISTSKSTTYSTTSKSTTKLNDISNPFDGPFTTIPKDSEKLKKIGQYCLKIKTKDSNCDRALMMLKDKFKKCEKSPKSDADCQTFKMNLCGAFSNFPCCADILAGRTCSGSKTPMRRNFYFM